MNVFLTGATGTLGRRLIPYLKGEHHLTLLRHRKEPAEICKAKWVYADLADADTLNGLLKDIDCVIHLAAVTHTDDINRYFECNVIGTRNIVIAAQANKVKHFIFVSTRAISSSGGAYSQSKLAAEDIVKKSRLNWTIVRPAEIYGAGAQDMVSLFARLLRTANFALIPADKTLKIAPLFVDDIVRFIQSIIINDRSFNKVYTLTGPVEYGFPEFIDSLAYYFRKDKKIIKISLPLMLIRVFLEVNYRLRLFDGLCRDQVDRLKSEKDFDSSLAAKDFDFRPLSLEEGIRLCSF